MSSRASWIWKLFSHCIKPNISLFTRVVKGEPVIPDFHLFGKEIETIFRDCRSDTSGANVDYIPQLCDAEAERFGLSTFTADEQQLHLGDCDETFSAQSTTKAINYCLAVEQNCPQIVHSHVGLEPSGGGI